MSWKIYKNYVRCNPKRGLCHRCQANPNARPHGPYLVLRQTVRDGATGRASVYLGSAEAVGPTSPDVISAINKRFPQDEKPEKEDVLAVIQEAQDKLEYV